MTNILDKKFIAAGIGLGLLTSVTHANPSGGVTETTINKCLILPPINVDLIHNDKTGDQSALGERSRYLYEYAYKAKRKVKLTNFVNTGRARSQDVFITDNKTQRFRAKEVDHVKNLANKFVEARKYHQCD